MAVQQKTKPQPGPIRSQELSKSPAPALQISLTKVLVGVAAALLVGSAGLGIINNLNSVGEPFSDPSEKITPAVMQQLENNRALLEKNGLKSGNIYVRDYGAVDNDGVTVNGTLRYALTAAYQTFSSAPGALKLSAIEGTSGCSTIEVRDDAGAIYQLCLRSGDPITTFTR